MWVACPSAGAGEGLGEPGGALGGLTLFVEHPAVPMDNHAAERVQRGPVVGRQNY